MLSSAVKPTSQISLLHRCSEQYMGRLRRFLSKITLLHVNYLGPSLFELLLCVDLNDKTLFDTLETTALGRGRRKNENKTDISKFRV